jgi:hypothetical protein
MRRIPKKSLKALRPAKLRGGPSLSPLFLQDLSLNPNHYIFHWNFSFGRFGRLLRQVQETHAAGNLHNQNG